MLVLVLSAIIALILKRTIYGLTVLAIGQNPRAARLAGLSVDLARFATYVLSALLSGWCRAQYGRRFPPRFDRRRRHRRHLGRRRARQCARRLGCCPLHLSP